ncbi:hypothetical protein QJS10_CPB19g00707 [Acorus calamus]|uniref:GRF-type domain-containing protein n=1 Tax=Acorus calamus TaxID=4465 RepID=A0AAV9CHW3_ACOCL|nr:hypothetical protein QJS10_CPB19g00707 [Acorus calamus]
MTERAPKRTQRSSHLPPKRTPKVTKSLSPKRRRTLADPPVRPVNSLRNSNVRPLPAHIRPRECRCKKGECPIYTSRQEHSKGRRFYCCPFNRTPQDCRFFEWIDDADDPIIELKFQLENHKETMTKRIDDCSSLQQSIAWVESFHELAKS